MFKVSDANGNCFFTDSKQLVEKIVKLNDNPFVSFGRIHPKLKVAKEHIVKSYADFCIYFY